MQKRFKLLRALAVPMALIAGSTAAHAETITFANNAGQSGGTFTIGNTVQISEGRISAVAVTPGPGSSVTGLCGSLGCLELVTGAYIGPDGSTGANDYIYSGAGSSITITGNVTGAGATGVLYSGSYDASTNIRLTFDNECFSGTCFGSLGGTLDGGTLNSVLASFFGISTSLQRRQRYQPVLQLRRLPDRFGSAEQPGRRRRGEHQQPADADCRADPRARFHAPARHGPARLRQGGTPPLQQVARSC